MAASVNPRNDAYGGGAIVRSSPPTSGPQGALGALSGTPAGGPAGGVNPPATPFFARPNEGTNVRIPYSRVVPLSDPRGGGLRPTQTAEQYFKNGKGPGQQGFYDKEVMNETDTLHASRLAFVLAARSGGVLMEATTGIGVQGAQTTRLDGTLQDISYAVNSTMAPQLPGVDRFQKLCSFEYLERYVHVSVNVAKKTVVDLATLSPPPDLKGLRDEWSRGLLRSLVDRAIDRQRTIAGKVDLGGDFDDAIKAANGTAASDADKGPYKMDEKLLSFLEAQINGKDVKDKKALLDFVAALIPANPNAPTALDASGHYDKSKSVVGYSGLPASNANVLSIGDLAKRAGEFGSDINMDPTIKASNNATKQLTIDVKGYPLISNSVPMDKHPYRMQGIFTMDKTAFLRGRGIDSEIVEGSSSIKYGTGYPFGVSRNLGDEVAFAMLEKEMVKMGLFDWTPDGILLSKLDNVPQDALEDQRIDSRDGMLYNLSIQGPCLATNWTGKTEMAVMPMDKVFVLVVADVWGGRYVEKEAVDIVPQTLDGPLAQQVNTLLSAKTPAEALVVQRMKTFLATAGETVTNYPLQPLDNSVYTRTMSEDFSGSVLTGNGPDQFGLSGKRNTLKNESDEATYLTALQTYTGPTSGDFSGASFAYILLGFNAKIEKVMKRIGIPNLIINELLQALVGFEPSTGDPTITTGVKAAAIGKNWFPAPFVRSAGGVALTKPYSNAIDPNSGGSLAKLKTAIEEYVANFVSPLLTGINAGELDKLIDAAKARFDSSNAAEAFEKTLRALYSAPTNADVVVDATNNLSVSALAPYKYLPLLFNEMSPFGNVFGGDAATGPVPVANAVKALLAYRADSAEKQGKLQSAIKGKDIYPVDLGASYKYNNFVSFATTDALGTSNRKDISEWLDKKDPATYERYAEASSVMKKLFALNNNPAKQGTFADIKAGALQADEFAVKNAGSVEEFDKEANIERTNADGTLRRKMTNFRLRLSTSSEMINDSGLAFNSSSGAQMPRSRMGLAIGNRVSEYIVGGWCIGTVMDSAASRASSNLGANLGVRSAPNTAAHSIYVNIEWWSGDKLYRSYANVENMTRARHVAPKPAAAGATRLPTDVGFPDPYNGNAEVFYAYGPEDKVNRPTEGFYSDGSDALLAGGARSIPDAAAEAEGFTKIESR